MDIHIKDGDVTVDAELLGRLFDLAPVQIPQLMRTHAVKGICERGIDTHHGEFRLSSFSGIAESGFTSASQGRSCDARSLISAADRCRVLCTAPHDAARNPMRFMRRQP